jgi:hypothetical protein
LKKGKWQTLEKARVLPNNVLWMLCESFVPGMSFETVIYIFDLDLCEKFTALADEKAS